MNKYVIYTVITNGYDKLLEPDKVQSEIDYICFTDSNDLKSNTWKIEKMPEWTKNIPNNKRQRMLKVLPHIILPEYEMSLYIDGNIKIKGDVKNMFKIVSGHTISIPQHPTRTCIYREGIAVMRMKKDTPEHVMPQMERFLAENFPTENGMFETNIIFRRHNESECKRLMDRWALEIMMGSHRDQLSLTYAMWATGVKVFGLPKTTRNSDVFCTNMRHGENGPGGKNVQVILKNAETKPMKHKKATHPVKAVNKIKQNKSSKKKTTNKKPNMRISALSLLS